MRSAPSHAPSPVSASSSRDGVAPRAEELEGLRLAVEAGLRSPDDAVADEERQHVVAVLALRLRHVHLEAVEEVEERVRAVAVVDQAVEGGEKRGAIGDGAVALRPDALPSPPS